MVKITTTEHRYRRSVNGGWLSNGRDVSAVEVPEADVGRWLASGSDRVAEWPDGFTLSVYPRHAPAHGYGWGPLMECEDPTHLLGRRLLRFCDRLPGWALDYYGVREVLPEVAATARPLER